MKPITLYGVTAPRFFLNGQMHTGERSRFEANLALSLVGCEENKLQVLLTPPLYADVAAFEYVHMLFHNMAPRDYAVLS